MLLLLFKAIQYIVAQSLESIRNHGSSSNPFTSTSASRKKNNPNTSLAKNKKKNSTKIMRDLAMFNSDTNMAARVEFPTTSDGQRIIQADESDYD
jgi:hypothetical protein